MQIGDNVVRKSHNKDVTFKIIDIKGNQNEKIYILKGTNLRIIADSPETDLEIVLEDNVGKIDQVFNDKVNVSIKNILLMRNEQKKRYCNCRIKKNIKSEKYNNNKEKELIFGRPGKILHIDGDAHYMDQCLKVYKQLELNAEGRIIQEREQPSKVLGLVKSIKPDIVVITGHDGMVKEIKNFLDLKNYRNSKYFVEAVSILRDYEPNYDDLVIFAGACQSCYEAILDAGANFATSPSRVLVHCLDPVFICEKIAYANIEKIVNTKEVLKNTITGVEGIGGLQTRGKYREGFPKSTYI